MATLYATTTRILNELNRTDLSSQAADAIKTAISFYSGEQWGFNETQTTVSLVAGTYRYTLPADFVGELAVGVDSDGFRSLLDKTSLIDFESGFTTTLQGEPSRYCLTGDYIQFSPIPEATYSAVITYVHTLPELSDSASNQWISGEFEEMIRMRAEADLLENLIRGDDAAQQAIICRSREAEAYRRVRARRDRNLSTRIKSRGAL